MSEDSRKTVLKIGGDASEFKQAAQEAKAAGQDLAQAVTQAGQQAAKGLGGLGDGARKGADSIAREEGRITSSIRRLQLEYQTLGRTAAEKIEAKIDFKGLDPQKFSAAIADLKEAEAAAAQVQAQLAKASQADAFVANIRSQAEAIGKTRSQVLEMQAAQLGVADKIAPYIAKLREAEQGNKKLGDTSKLTAFQTQQIGFQLHDFGVQVLSGQSALTAFVQQGSQLAGTFGGAKNALQAVVSLITPFRAGMLAAAAGTAVFVEGLVHAEQGLQRLNTLQAQLAGTGRADLFSNDSLDRFVKQLAQAQGVTREVAGGIVSELSKAHDIGGGMFTDLAKLANDYARATGTTATAAAATLAKAFSDPAQGAKELDKALGTLTSSQILAIEKLARQGDTLGAQRALYDAVSQSIKGLADNAATPLQKSVNDLGNAWNRAMDAFSHSEGLRTVNSLLGKSIGMVQWLIEHSDKLGGLGTLGLALVPGGLPSAAGGAIGSGVLGLLPSPTPRNPVSSGKVVDLSGQPVVPGAPAAPGPPARGAADDIIKKQLEVAAGYQSEAGKIADLTDKRRALNKALEESNALYGASSAQSAKLREGIAGIGKEIRNLAKAANSEQQAVIDAQLQGQVKIAQEALARERDTIAFQQKFLSGQYQAGEVSVVQFYDAKRRAIEAGVAAEISALEKERSDVQAHLAKTVDPGKRQQDTERLAEIARKEADVRTQGGREVQIANQEQTASYRQLADQVANYRAELLQLQGDEVGAARIRAQQAILQASITARQSASTAGAITPAELEAQRVALDQQIKLNAAKNAGGIINQALQLEEERIADAQRRGQITSSQALDQTGEVRRRAVAQLEEIVKAQEEVARTRPQDYRLQIDTAAARQELERLKEQLDPLAERFRTLFTDATGNLFADLANDPKNAKQAVKKWFTGIMGDINAQMGKDLATSLFGKDGPLGDLPAGLSNLLRGKGGRSEADKPLVDTTGLTQSLSALQVSGIDPATSSLVQFTQAVQGAAVAVGGGKAPGQTSPMAGFPQVDDEGNPMPEVLKEQAVSTQQATVATREFAASSNQMQVAFAGLGLSVLDGSKALSLLPRVVQMIVSSVMSAGGGAGAGLGSWLSNLLSGSGGAAASKPFVGGDIGFVPVAHTGAIVGEPGMSRMVSMDIFRSARKYHGGGLAGDEVPAILRRGEGVFTQGQMKALGGSGDVTIVNNGVPVQVADRRTMPDGSQVITLKQAEEFIAGRLADPNSRVSKSMQSNYGVTRNR